MGLPLCARYGSHIRMNVTPHFPPNFAEGHRPHIYRRDGVWWTVWPLGVSLLSPEVVEQFGAWLRKMNNVSLPSPQSFNVPPVETRQ